MFSSRSVAAVISLVFTVTVFWNLHADSAFSSKKNLSHNAGLSISTRIAVAGNNVYVAWSDDTPSPLVFDIFFRRSTNGGATFGPVTNLSNNSGNSEELQITADGTNVYLIWVDDTPGDPSIFLRRSTNNGTSFDPIKNLSVNASAEEPQLAVSGNNVYAVWAQANGDIFLRRSTDSGATFGSKGNLSNNSGDSITPQIDTAGSFVYVAWEDGTPSNEEIFFRRSSDNGSTFTPTKNLSKIAGGGFSGFHSLAVSSANLYIAWLDDSPGNDDILFRRSTNNGASFGPVRNLSNNPTHSEEPQVAVSGSNVYVTWENDNASLVSEILFKRSTDGGSTFKGTKNLSNNTGFSQSPQIDVAGKNVFVVWPDDTLGNEDILFRMSTNNGAAFNNTENLSNNSGGSEEPQVAAGSAGKVFAVWSDGTPGNVDVLFRSGP